MSKKIKNCYDITTIKAELNSITENKERRLRYIEDKLHSYYNRVYNMKDTDKKRILEERLNQLKIKLYYQTKRHSLFKQEEFFKLNNNISQYDTL